MNQKEKEAVLDKMFEHFDGLINIYIEDLDSLPVKYRKKLDTIIGKLENLMYDINHYGE